MIIVSNKFMKKVMLFFKKGSDLAMQVSAKANDYLLSLGVQCFYENELTKDEISNIDAIITFGGDGTILSAARKYIDEEIPVMGFNVGKLGFLSEFSINYLQAEIDNLMAGNYKISSRFVLFSDINNKRSLAINDFVIKNVEHYKLITLSVFAGEHYIGDYRADGLIISTPTGSTAYSLACGGPIICPDASVYCITPISPHTLTLRPLVIPTSKPIRIKLASNSNGAASVIADGYNIGEFSIYDKLEIVVYDREAKFIVPLESNYFDTLRNKLLWAEKIVKS